MNSQTKKIFMLIVLIAFLSLSFLGLSMHETKPSSTTMAQSSGCPYMVGGYSLCSTNILDHISAWQGATRGILSETFSITTLLIIFAFAFSIIAGLLASILPFFFYERLKGYFIYKKQLAKILSWLSLLENSPSFK